MAISPDLEVIPSFVFSKGIRYRQNGIQPFKDVGAEVFAWGTPLPPTQVVGVDGGAATGSVDAGTYLIHCVGENLLGNKGLPFDTENPESVVVALATSSIDITLPVFSDPQVKSVLVYRTRKDEAAPFFFAAGASNGTTALTLNGGDSSLALDDFLEPPDVNAADTAAFAGPFKYKTPPSKSLVEVWDGRIWTAGERIYDTGKFSAVDGMDVFTGNALVLLNENMEGKGFIFDDENFVYTIEEVLNDTQFRAAQNYRTPPSGTDATDSDFEIFGDRNSLRFSEAAEVEYFPEENELQIGDEDGGHITAINEFLDRLITFSESKIYSVHQTGDPTSPYGRKQSLSTVGTVGPRSVVKTNHGLFFWGGDGFYRFSNMTSEEISIPLGSYTDVVIDPEFIKGMEFKDRIYWFCHTDGNGYLDTVFVFSLVTGVWDVFRDLRVIDAAVIVTTTGEKLLYFNQPAGTGFGLYTFREDALNDGAHALDLSGVVTGATLNTITDSSQVFPTIGIAITGLIVRIRTGVGAGQERRILSNTATAITVETDWTTIPQAGDTYTIGAISHQVGSGQHGFGAPQELKTVKHLEFGMGG